MTTRLTIVLFYLLQACLASCGASEERTHSIFPREARLRTGDVVMRRGLGFASHAVTFADRGGAYSHIGIVAWEDGEWMVVHAVPGEPDFPGDEDRVKMEPLDAYFRSDRAGEGCVLRCVDSLAAARAAREAVNVYRRGTLLTTTTTMPTPRACIAVSWWSMPIARRVCRWWARGLMISACLVFGCGT